MQTTIYDMHKRIVKLDKELENSVTRLNESSATLIARVDESDQQTKMLRGLLEENQAKLDALSRELEGMKTTLYRHWNLTTSGTPAGPPRNVATGAVTIEGPPTLAPPPAQNELEGSAPIPTEAQRPVPTPPPSAPPVPPAPEVAKMAQAVPQQTSALPTPQEPPAEPLASASGRAGDPRVLYQQAQKSYANEDYAGALKQFDTYLAQYPNNDLSANALFWKAKCLFNLNRHAESIEAFESLRSKFPTSTKVPFAMHNQAVAHSRLGQNAQAERLMEAVIEQYPISPAADQAREDLRKLRGQ